VWRLAASLLGALLAALLVLPAWGQEWHDAYRQGLKALAQGRHAQAVEQFERAVVKRPQPGVNVVTYGTNVEEHYFPYLRLASAYLAVGRPDAAGAALRLSARYGIEPAAERERLRAQVESLLASTHPTPVPTPTASSTPPMPTSANAAPPAPAPASPSPPTSAGEPLPAPAASLVPLTRSTPMTSARPKPHATAAPPSAAPPTPAPVPTPSAPAATTGTLEIVTRPGGVEAYLDDERVGVTDRASGRLLARGLAARRYRLRLAVVGHADHTADVDVRAGAIATQRAELTALPARDDGSWGAALLAIVAVLSALGLAGFLWLRPGRSAEGSPMGLLTRSQRPQPAARDAAATPARPVTPRASVGETFGEYLLVELLGRGGMAAVYLARRRGEDVALKRPLPQHLEDAHFLERFLREAEIGATLHHPNIVRVFERGDVQGVPYLTMELVPGETLATWLRRQPLPPIRRAAALVRDIAQALDYAHLKGVVHRDLKPSNVMVLPDGMAKVMDYGIARARRFDGLTATGEFLGTPDYMAPEIIDGRGSTAASDLYALGIIFFELLTGRRPFSADTPYTTLRRHCTESPQSPRSLRADVPEELEGLVLRLLAKEPAERPAGAEELLQSLNAWLTRSS
jgi:serine/threonine-protein kinase